MHLDHQSEEMFLVSITFTIHLFPQMFIAWHCFRHWTYRIKQNREKSLHLTAVRRNSRFFNSTHLLKGSTEHKRLPESKEIQASPARL